MSSPRDRFGPAFIPVMLKALLSKRETHVGSSPSSPISPYLQGFLHAMRQTVVPLFDLAGSLYALYN